MWAFYKLLLRDSWQNPTSGTIGIFTCTRSLPDYFFEWKRHWVWIWTDGNRYLDMRDLYIQIKAGLQKGRLFDEFMKKGMEKRIWPRLSQMTIFIIKIMLTVFYTHFSPTLKFVLPINKCIARIVSMDTRLSSNEFNASAIQNDDVLAFHR